MTTEGQIIPEDVRDEHQAITAAMKSALKWLINRNADGVFDKFQVLVAAGDRAPVMRSTWNKLAKAGLVEHYLKNRRLKVTVAGLALNLRDVRESEAH